MNREAITEKLRTFRVLVLDADGVFFDGRETRTVVPATPELHESVQVSKTRDFRDGQGISFLRAIGIRVMFASGEDEPLGSIVRKMNALPTAKEWGPVGLAMNLKAGKVRAIHDWLISQTPASGQTFGWDDVLYVGDDRTDLEAMKLAGLVAVPSDAQRVVLPLAHLVLTKPGGAGAIRQLAELVLDARGVDEAGLPTA